MNKSHGSLFIVSAPSGAGKTSLIKALIESDRNLSLSISHTTRAPRLGEVDGREYHFIPTDEFKRMLSNHDFLEHAEVYGNCYGTSRSWVNAAISSGNDILFEIDCQGAKQIKKIFPEAIGIFILPPSIDALAARLKNRAQDDAAVIQKRLAAAREEINHINEFDYIVINHRFDDALDELVCIIRATRLRKQRQLAAHLELIAQLS
ncbi:MAG: guanylate kinase [Nitrosomonas sp.]|nr:MAG: guanylate kinase [Nitrosomonas sp.]